MVFLKTESLESILNGFMCPAVTTCRFDNSKTRVTHNTSWLLILAPSSLISGLAHQPLYHLSVILTCVLSLTSSLTHALSTDSNNLLDDLLPQTSPPSSLDLGIISPGKPSLHSSSSTSLTPYSSPIRVLSTLCGNDPSSLLDCVSSEDRKHLFCLQFCPQGLPHSWYYIKYLLKEWWINYLKLFKPTALPSAQVP